MLSVVFDAAPLITACKFAVQNTGVIDHLLAGCRMVITPSVEEEVAVIGARYPDGIVAGERIARGDLQVVPVEEPRWGRHLASYALGRGERDSIELCGQLQGNAALVTDDYLAFVAAIRQGLTVRMLPDVVVELTKHGNIARETAEAILETIRPRYRVGAIEHSMVHLQEVQ